RRGNEPGGRESARRFRERLLRGKNGPRTKSAGHSFLPNSQGRPLAVQPLAFDLAYLLFADAEALGHLLARAGRRGAGVLGLHQRQENLPAAVFRQLPFLVLWHVTLLWR